MYLYKNKNSKGGVNIKYFLVPKKIIYEYELSEKRIIVYIYFASKQGLDDTVGFSCDSIVKWAGYKTNYHKNKINDEISNLVNSISENGFFALDGNIIGNNFVEAQLNIEEFYPDNQFALIYNNELEKIINFKQYTKDVNRMNSSILLLVLSYLRSNMLRRQAEYNSDKSDKPEFCYRMYKDIEADIGLSSRYISRAVKILDEMGILAYKILPRWKDESDNWHTEVTLFANRYKYKDNRLDDSYNYEQELEWGEEYIKDKKHYKQKD